MTSEPGPSREEGDPETLRTNDRQVRVELLHQEPGLRPRESPADQSWPKPRRLRQVVGIHRKMWHLERATGDHASDSRSHPNRCPTPQQWVWSRATRRMILSGYESNHRTPTARDGPPHRPVDRHGLTERRRPRDGTPPHRQPGRIPPRPPITRRLPVRPALPVHEADSSSTPVILCGSWPQTEPATCR